MKLFTFKRSVANKIFIVMVVLNLLISFAVYELIINSSESSVSKILTKHLSISKDNANSITDDKFCSIALFTAESKGIFNGKNQTFNGRGRGMVNYLLLLDLSHE